MSRKRESVELTEEQWASLGGIASTQGYLSWRGLLRGIAEGARLLTVPGGGTVSVTTTSLPEGQMPAPQEPERHWTPDLDAQG